MDRQYQEGPRRAKVDPRIVLAPCRTDSGLTEGCRTATALDLADMARDAQALAVSLNEKGRGILLQGYGEERPIGERGQGFNPLGDMGAVAELLEGVLYHLADAMESVGRIGALAAPGLSKVEVPTNHRV